MWFWLYCCHFTILAVEILGTQVERYPTVPNIYPGVQSEEERVLAQNQRAMYRRLFMDIEREQVKENLRRRKHRKKVSEYDILMIFV